MSIILIFRKIFLFIVFLFLPIYVFAGNKYQLIFSVDVVRHGDRTPSITIPIAPYRWKEGLNQLTVKGMEQEYQLGRILNTEYILHTGLLPEHYQSKILYVRSSDFDRTLMSAESLLYGLYPLGTGPQEVSNHSMLPQRFQPIPIHTVAKENDNLLLAATANNAEYQQLLARYVRDKQFWRKKEASLASQFVIWSAETGIPIYHLQDVVPVADALYIRSLYNIPLPPNMKQADADKMIATERWVLVHTFAPYPIGKFMSENFFIQLKKDLLNATQSDHELKYKLYLAHESTIMGLMSGLHVPVTNIPAYASDLRFELLQDSEKNYWVKVIYNDAEIKLPSCGTVCPLEKFYQIIS